MNEWAATHGEEIREKIKNCIIQYINEHGYPPSYREIGDMAGLKSPASVKHHMEKMFEMGMLETDHGIGMARVIRVPGYKFVKENDYGIKRKS